MTALRSYAERADWLEHFIDQYRAVPECAELVAEAHALLNEIDRQRGAALKDAITTATEGLMSEYRNEREHAIDTGPSSGYRIGHVAPPRIPRNRPGIFADGKWASRAIGVALLLAIVALYFVIPMKGPY